MLRRCVSAAAKQPRWRSSAFEYAAAAATATRLRHRESTHEASTKDANHYDPAQDHAVNNEAAKPPMNNPIDFYFDFSSPYGYFAAMRIDELATRHGRQVRWQPYLMGVAMKLSGAQPLTARELVKDYAAHDLARTARLYGLPFALPTPFPIATVAAARAFWWLNERDIGQAKVLAKALYRAYFADGRNIGESAVVSDVAVHNGIERSTMDAALADDKVKAKLKTVTANAIAAGVFGSPFFIVDGEAFWGNDRVSQVDEWLSRGGW
jgi:2-hydroxychromene-2-carboxylate isomerase